MEQRVVASHVIPIQRRQSSSFLITNFPPCGGLTSSLICAKLMSTSVHSTHVTQTLLFSIWVLPTSRLTWRGFWHVCTYDKTSPCDRATSRLRLVRWILYRITLFGLGKCIPTDPQWKKTKTSSWHVYWRIKRAKFHRCYEATPKQQCSVRCWDSIHFSKLTITFYYATKRITVCLMSTCITQ